MFTLSCHRRGSFFSSRHFFTAVALPTINDAGGDLARQWSLQLTVT